MRDSFALTPLLQRATRLLKLTAAVVLVALGLVCTPARPVDAATITVTNANDTQNTGDGCSLREAILNANTDDQSGSVDCAAGSGADTISFGLANGVNGVSGSGPYVISAGPLPPITAPLTIDGYSRPGATANTLPNSTNAVLRIELSGPNLVFGTDSGLTISGPSVTVRGLAIHRFSRAGILVTETASNVLITGNYLGTAVTGLSAPDGNKQYGVEVAGADSVQVGTSDPAHRNVLSGNHVNGVFVHDGSGNNPANGFVVEGNFIGVGANGTTPLGNYREGVYISAPAPMVGGQNTSSRNVISGNGFDPTVSSPQYPGVFITGAGNARLLRNVIGTNVEGAALGNSGYGIHVNSTNVNIGIGTLPPLGNIISANMGGGVHFTAGGGLYGNTIRGNQGDGVTISAGNVSIGTSIPQAGNSISENNGFGVRATGSNVAVGIVQTSVANNAAAGVSVEGGAFAYIGSTEMYGLTSITGNGGNGVQVIGDTSGFRLSPSGWLQGNVIHSNGKLGIDLGNDGVTPNDPQDTGTGPGTRLNFPVITSASNSGQVTATLNSTPNQTFGVTFFASNTCDPSGYGEGRRLIGSAGATTDGNGNASFSMSRQNYDVTIAAGEFITAITLDAAGQTSEFSACEAVVDGENHTPNAGNDSYQVAQGSYITVPDPGVLANDTDQDTGQRLLAQLLTSPSHGDLQFNATGGFSYTPFVGFIGTDSFTYRVTDGKTTSNTATVNITVTDGSATQCTPRPKISTSVAPGGDKLQVHIESTALSTRVSNPLQQIQFGQFQNAKVTLNGQSIASGQTFTVPSGATSVDFTVERITQGQPTTVPLTVVDACGPWTTFVGGGTSAGF